MTWRMRWGKILRPGDLTDEDGITYRDYLWGSGNFEVLGSQTDHSFEYPSSRLALQRGYFIRLSVPAAAVMTRLKNGYLRWQSVLV